MLRLFFTLFFLSLLALEGKIYSFLDGGKEVVLTPVKISKKSFYASAGTKYYKTEDEKIVGISDSLLIKTKKHIKKSDLQKFKELKEIRQIGVFESFSIYSARLHEKTNIFEFINDSKLSKKYIVSPDLLVVNKEFTDYKLNEYVVINQEDIRKIAHKGDGKGVSIAVIDDGFDFSHKEFKDLNVKFSYDVDQKSLDPAPKSSLDGHGTRVVGVIFGNTTGLVPKANLIAIRQTSNWLSDIILAFNIANMAGADVINCSWTLPFVNQVLKDVLNEISTKGVTIVFSAGNDSCEIEKCNPVAALKSVVSVGSITKKGKLTKFSNYGREMDFATVTNLKTVSSSGYIKIAGTSASAPVISGLIAKILSSEEVFVKKEAVQILKKTVK